MNEKHKAALAEGREQGRIIRAYLEAINTPGKRGRKRTPDSIRRRLNAISQQLATADALTAVVLRQERMNLERELERLTQPKTGPAKEELEKAFVSAAKPYSERKGISYAAWREAGVPTAVLKRAGIQR